MNNLGSILLEHSVKLPSSEVESCHSVLDLANLGSNVLQCCD